MAMRSTIFAIAVIAVLLMARATSATPECVRECVPKCTKSGGSEKACTGACTTACNKAQLDGFFEWGWGWGGIDVKVPEVPKQP
ncbi:hypothetical protein NL676_037328 [Syzygium grande]|nr:hypothetical protein NL676_037328 [Syzygium grande]